MPREDSERRQRKKYDNRPMYMQNYYNIPSKLAERETDAKRLTARQRQIDFGKNTVGYRIYTEKVPREERRRNDPWTPDKTVAVSKRCWDGVVRKWRRQLHEYDPASAEGEIVIDLKNEENMWNQESETEEGEKENDHVQNEKQSKAECKITKDNSNNNNNFTKNNGSITKPKNTENSPKKSIVDENELSFGEKWSDIC